MLGLGDVFYRAMAGGAGSGAALDQARTYGHVMFAGAPLILLANLLANAVRGTGHMRLPAFTIVGGEALHLILSPLLILGWGPIPSLGMSGAALAALSPYLFGTMVLFLYLRAGRGVVRLSFARGQLSGARFWAILRVGLAASLTTVFNQAQALFLTAMIGGFGTAGIAAFAGAVRLELVQMPVVFALGTALVTMVGTNIGAGNGERARRIAWLGGLVGGLIGAVVAVVCLAMPLSWMSLFTPDAAVAEIGAQYLRAIGLSTVPFCVGLALYFAAQGAGQAWTVIVAMLIRAGVTIGGGWLAVGLLGGGLHALFLVTSAGAALMGVWMIAVVAHTRWRV
jgi:Na+-driven multidrug efflux pump